MRERSLEERLARVERARRGVEQAAYLDAYLNKEGAHSLEDFFQAYGIEEGDVADHLKTRFGDVMREWDRIAAGHAGVRDTLARLAQEKYGSSNAEDLGRLVFDGISAARHTDYRPPVGKIEAIIQGPYLVVYAHDRCDYASMYEEGSGGTYHRSGYTRINLNEAELFPNILMVNSAPDGLIAKSTVEHERQHFINERWMEGEGVKDEVLAYLKDGSRPSYLAFLREKLYAHLWDRLSPEDKQNLDAQLTATMTALTEAESAFSTLSARALLFHASPRSFVYSRRTRYRKETRRAASTSLESRGIVSFLHLPLTLGNAPWGSL